MKLEQLKEAKLAGVRLPDRDQIEHAIAEYLVFGAMESLKQIKLDNPETNASMDSAKDLAYDSMGFQLNEMFPGIEEKIRKL